MSTFAEALPSIVTSYARDYCCILEERLFSNHVLFDSKGTVLDTEIALEWVLLNIKCRRIVVSSLLKPIDDRLSIRIYKDKEKYCYSSEVLTNYIPFRFVSEIKNPFFFDSVHNQIETFIKNKNNQMSS